MLIELNEKFETAECDLLSRKEHYNPHRFLGRHGNQLRFWKPGSRVFFFEHGNELVEAILKDERGLFEYTASSLSSVRVFDLRGKLHEDPYQFNPTFQELDEHFFSNGVHYKIYEALGAHPFLHQGVQGVKFAVWAPSALSVSLVGDFNGWNEHSHPMRGLGSSGVFELFIPGLEVGEKYKFQIHTKQGALLKADPYGHAHEVRPQTASVVADVNAFSFQDQVWMKERSLGPMNVYEVHLPSWKKLSNYKEIAAPLASYCKEMGFTHVELLPITEYPFDESWGYQVSGFFAPTSRLGSPSDFQYFVDYLHQEKIGVILDWVPAHFPMDAFSLTYFDGTALYEHQDPKQGYHPHWHTSIFNYGRKEVSNFLLGSALFWFDKMHVDGLRVDAVASMLYLDYGREEGEWVPNCYGGKENLEAIEFLKHLNSVVHEKFPGALMIAEESTAFPGITQPQHTGGMGFDMKWNMGWMNDTLRYFERDPIYRKYHQGELTFGLLYAFSEQFILPFSHDEVVHGKKSLLSKMPGDEWQRFSNLRLLYSYMICQPGKKLFFMGGELAQYDEWRCKEEVQWFLLKYPYHHGFQKCVKALNHFYLNYKALWERDFDISSFEWVDFSDEENSVISYLRKGHHTKLLCVHNFTPNFFPRYTLFLKGVNTIKEVFTTDEMDFGGSGQKNSEVHIEPDHISITLAPLATQIFEYE